MNEKKIPAKILIKRLQRAYKIMDKMTPHERRKHFDMGKWGQKTECGTVGCLAGHCGLDPWFKKEGFEFRFDKKPDSNGRFYGGFVGGWRKPEQFFGTQIHYQILMDTDAKYGQIKRKVAKAIEHLKKDGVVGYLGT